MTRKIANRLRVMTGYHMIGPGCCDHRSKGSGRGPASSPVLHITWTQSRASGLRLSTPKLLTGSTVRISRRKTIPTWWLPPALKETMSPGWMSIIFSITGPFLLIPQSVHFHDLNRPDLPWVNRDDMAVDESMPLFPAVGSDCSVDQHSF